MGSPNWLSRISGIENIPQDLILPIKKDSEIQRIVDSLLLEERLALDTETGGPRKGRVKDIKTGDRSIPVSPDGLDPNSRTSEIVLFQIGNLDMTYVIEPQFIPYFRPVLESKRFLVQNGLHDYKFLLRKYDIRLYRMYDTMLAEQVLHAGDEGWRVHLAALARHYCNVVIRKDVREEFNQWPLTLDYGKLHYAARDVFLLWKICAKQSELIQKLNLRKAVIDEMRVIPITAEMELTGVVLDPKAMPAVRSYYEREITRVEDEIFTIYNKLLQERNVHIRTGLIEAPSSSKRHKHTFNLQAPAEKIKALERIGIEVANVRRSTLAEVEDTSGIINQMMVWSKYHKILSTYGENLMAQVHPDTKAFHPRFFQHGAGESAEAEGEETTATGRFTSNFQQIPRPEKVLEEVTDIHELNQVRKFFGLDRAA